MSFSSAIGEFNIGNSPIEGFFAGPAGTGSAQQTRIYDRVQSVLGSVTQPTLDQLLWDTIDEFAIRSRYFQQKVYWQMGASQSTVDFNPFSADMVTIWVLYVFGLWDFRVDPPAVLVDTSNPVATITRTGYALLALKPVDLNSALVSPWMGDFWTTWYETILDGVFFRLYGQPMKPWSNPQLTTYHGTRFRQGINRARDIADRLHSHQQAQRRRYPYYAMGRRKN